MSSFDPTAYGLAFAPLVDIDRRRPLDAGQPMVASRKQLQALTIESAFAHVTQASNNKAQLADTDMAACCLAGVWLLHDFLAESHTISQAIDTTSGSFWHGIMHRREGDYSNAKYWFRRVGRHPVFHLIPQATSRDHWDPVAFVDDCQAALLGNTASRDRCLDLQRLEWETLFDWCYRSALGDTSG